MRANLRTISVAIHVNGDRNHSAKNAILSPSRRTTEITFTYFVSVVLRSQTPDRLKGSWRQPGIIPGEANVALFAISHFSVRTQFFDTPVQFSRPTFSLFWISSPALDRFSSASATSFIVIERPAVKSVCNWWMDAVFVAELRLVFTSVSWKKIIGMDICIYVCALFNFCSDKNWHFSLSIFSRI